MRLRRWGARAAGNRLSRTGDGDSVAYAYGPGDRLAAWTDGVYEYDAAGCVTRIRRGSDVLDLAWDGLYRLVSVSTNGVVAESYRYDALGRRTATVNAEGTERHVWDGDHCLADVDEEGNVLRAYLWGPGVDNLLAVRVGGRNYAALTDIQGTVWGYADERGEIVARWTYDAWGNVLSEEVNVPALAAVRYRFQGREFSRATGLTNFRARWYDPTTGRWLSKDPSRLCGGLNLYGFCENDPVNRIDPSGRIAWFIPAIAGAITGGVIGGISNALSGKSFWKGELSGAIGGAVTGLTMGLGSGLFVGGLAGWLGGLSSSLVDVVTDDSSDCAGNTISRAVTIGIIGGAITGGIGGKLSNEIGDKLVGIAIDTDATIITTTITNNVD